jgi:hypothetical protein
MCLACRKRKNELIPIQKENGYYVGWKIFRKVKKCLEFRFMISPNNIPVKTWLNEKTYRDSTLNYISFAQRTGSYKKGFHIYTTKEEARCKAREYYSSSLIFRDTIKKVYFKQITAQGYQGDVPVIVAKQMFICGRV